jgi:alanyl-tRNA synthetase
MAKLDKNGKIAWAIDVTDMRKPAAGAIVHIGNVSYGIPRVGDSVIARVDVQRRHDIMRNHTATHLLHAALRQVLGDHARQAGSLVAPDRLRFDFNHPEAMTPEQIERVEKIVNDAVAADLEVLPKLKSREDAIAEGAMALFGEKYGETVRTITILESGGSPVGMEASATVYPTAAVEQQPKYSYELCGGTHLERTSDVGAFLIVSEGSAAAGVRRIEAVTGRGAYDLVARRFKAVKRAAALASATPEELPGKVEALQDELAEVRKQLASLRQQVAMTEFIRRLEVVTDVAGVPVLTAQLSEADAESLRQMTDRFRQRYPNGVAVLVSVFEDRPLVVAAVAEELVERGLKAGELIAAIGGKGGGRPSLAQGSLPDASKASEVLVKVVKVVEEKLK